jgi:hypothetical protein
MKVSLLIGSMALVASAMISKPTSTNFSFAGNFQGYLTPCGCVKPMKGGIVRLATAIQAIPGHVVFLGPLSDGVSARQQELKADAILDLAKEVGAKAVTIGSQDKQLGDGVLRSLQGRTGLLVQSDSQDPSIASTSAELGDFHMFSVGAGATAPYPFDGLSPASVILHVDAPLTDARKFAGKARIVFYRLDGEIPPQPFKEKGTAFLTVGEKGKNIVQFSLTGGKLSRYRVVSLGPEVADDPGGRMVMSLYLNRVGREGLLARIPRQSSDPFAGSASCMSCHSEAHSTWSQSAHGAALQTLEKELHDKDPDCVGCHVVGLDKVGGFESRKVTPDLANVGCESCHGPAKAHVQNPEANRLPRVERDTCMTCHNVAHSPEFDFEKYWGKIKH